MGIYEVPANAPNLLIESTDLKAFFDGVALVSLGRLLVGREGEF